MDTEIIKEIGGKDKILFAYSLKNAIGMNIRSLYVTKDIKDNLYLVSGSNIDKKYTVGIDKLENILINNEKEFEEGKKVELPSALIMDGYINEFCFSVNGKLYSDKLNNLWGYDDNAIDNNKHLSIVFKIFNEMYDALESDCEEIDNYFVISAPMD